MEMKFLARFHEYYSGKEKKNLEFPVKAFLPTGMGDMT
jgi:hypothetical protein